MIKIKDLTKSFANNGFCLGPMDLQIDSGQSVALIGQNGSGKSTFFQILTGNTEPSSGEVSIFGQKMSPEKYELKKSIGYLAQHLGLPKWLTGLDILTYATKLYQLDQSKDRIESALAYWDCLDYRYRPMASCSHGMQKRVALALSSIHDPEILILDEPFSGLDLFHIKALKDLILDREKSGKLTILSTHIAPYAALLCRKAFYLNIGKITELSLWLDLGQLERAQYMEEVFLGKM